MRVRTVAPHPSYPNPTLQEALCEFHFADASSAWSPSKPGQLIEQLKDEYPDFETITEQGFAVALGPDGSFVPSQLPPRLKLKFSKRGDPPFLLQFHARVFSINVLRPYPGWDAFRRELLKVWPVIVEVIQPTLINRIGMRYINRIQRQNRNETPGVWLKRNKFVPEALLESLPDFLARLETSIDNSNRITTTISLDRSVSLEPHGALILDIDRIAVAQTPCDAVIIEAAIKKLHDDVWDVFAELKNEKLEKLLNGETHESAA